MEFPRHQSALILASFVTVAAFVGATAYTQNELVSLDAVSSTIETNSVPSIQYLNRAGVALRRLRQSLHDGLSATPPRGEALTEARTDLAALQRDIQEYLQLTPLPGELDLWDRLRADLSDAMAAARGALDAGERGEGSTAMAMLPGVDRALDEAGRTMLETMEFDVTQSERLAREVRSLRTSTRNTIILLDALATIVAGFAAFVAYRASRQHDRLLQAHNRLLAGRVAELDRFAGRVAHDILSPLDTIGVGLALVRRNADTRGLSQIERMQRAMHRVHQLVDGLLTFARSGAPPPGDTQCAVDAVLADVITDCAASAREQRIDLLVEPHDRLEVACSTGVVTSVVQNLVRNAIKYMGDRAVRTVRVRVRPSERMVRIEVEDSGPGIPAEQHAAIFEPFVRASRDDVSGVGLGLATVKRLVEGHGGAVGVRSDVGAGSLFWVELPRALRRSDAPAPIDPQPISHGA